MKLDIRDRQRSLFLPLRFDRNQSRQVRQVELVIQSYEVSLNLPSPHEMKSGEQYAVGIKQWLHSGRVLLFEQSPLSLSKTQIVMDGCGIA